LLQLGRDLRPKVIGGGHMAAAIPNGTRRLVEGVARVHYDGYWIKAYPTPADSLLIKRQLIEALTRRLFNHVEHGINVPGPRLEEARRAYDLEQDPRRKRVKGAMLAGALFNRVTDVFTKLVELQAHGVRINDDDELMRQCGAHLEEALALGKLVLHRSGEEGIDELWGEPFKAFAFPIEAFYQSRYAKIAHTMRAIDTIADELVATFEAIPMFAGIAPRVRAFAAAAKVKCETLRTEADIFDIWTSFVVSAEALVEFLPRLSAGASVVEQRWGTDGMALVRQGRDLISDMVRARVAMPKSTRELIERLGWYRSAVDPSAPASTGRGPQRRDPKRRAAGA
jgi:hypothetical protein